MLDAVPTSASRRLWKALPPTGTLLVAGSIPDTNALAPDAAFDVTAGETFTRAGNARAAPIVQRTHNNVCSYGAELEMSRN